MATTALRSTSITDTDPVPVYVDSAASTSMATSSTAATTASTTTTSSTDLGAILSAAIAGGYVAHLPGGTTYVVTSPIVINVTSTIQGPLGIDLGGATIVSQITDGSPVIQINVGPGVDFRYLTLSNFTIDGNGNEGSGIRLVADGNDRWAYCWTINNVTVKDVGGYGIDMHGSVFEGIVSNSWMVGNAQGGAYFSHHTGPEGGQVSALRWFGGGFDRNGGDGIVLDNGVRDLSVDGVTFTNNNGVGISAASGITSVTSSTFVDNKTAGVWFQNYGNFSDNSFTSSGVQTYGVTGWLNGDTSLIGNTSTYTGVGANPTVLADLQGIGNAFVADDSGTIVTGTNVAVSGEGGGNLAAVSSSSQGVALPVLSAVTALTTAAVAASTGTSPLETALKAAIADGTVVHLTEASYTVTSSIVINLTNSTQGSIGIDLGGAKIISQIAGGGPVIQINVGPGVDIGTLTLSNFSIQGNGSEGDGIKIVVDGTDRWIRDLDIHCVNVEHVGGIGLDVIGNVQGTVFDSWMHGNHEAGARFANSPTGGVASDLEWIGGGFRKNDGAGLILDNGTHDMRVQGAYFVDNNGPGLYASSGVSLVEQSGFENNLGTGALIEGTSNFSDVTFSTYGRQSVAIGGYLSGGQVSLVGVGNEYYGGGADPTLLTNIQGTGTLAMAGTGNVLVGSGITVTGGDPYEPPPADTIAATVASIVATGAGISGGTGELNAGDVVTLTVNMSEAVTVSGTPALLLNNGGAATYSDGSGTSALTFSYTVQAGQSTPDLAVASFGLNGGTLKDAAGNSADLSGAVNYQPAGILKIDTVVPTVSSIVASGDGIDAGNGSLTTDKVVTLTVNMTEVVTVSGVPTLSLGNGGTANFTGGSGSSALTFSYTVVAGQDTPNLTISSFNLNGGSVVDAAGNSANLMTANNYDPVGTLAVDTNATIPSLTSIVASGAGITNGTGTLAAGEVVTLTVNMSETVTVTGTPTLVLSNGGTATYSSGSGGKALTFTYTVGAGQSTPDLMVSSLNLNGGSMLGSAGNSALLSGAVDYNPAGTLKIDTVAPTVSSIVSSGTGIIAGSGTLGAGAVVVLTVNMSEAVTVSGTPTLALNNGGTAIYVGGSGSSALTFNYTIADGQNAADLIVGSLNLNGGSIVDAAGNAASLAAAAGYNPAGTLQIDTTAPALTAGLVSDTGASSADMVTASALLTGSAEPGAIVHFAIDGQANVATATATARGVWSLTPIGLTDGVHTVVASTSDAAGNTTGTSLTFTLDTKAPTVTAELAPTLTLATPGAALAPSQTLNGTAEPNSMVRFVLDDVAIAGTVTTDSSGRWMHTLDGLTAGQHTVIALQTDIAGNTGSASVSFTTATPPVVTASLASDTGASSSDGTTANAAIKGTADANAVVHFTIDGTSITTTAQADASGNWSFAPTGLADGQHTVVASVTNAGGATGTSALIFTLDTMAQTPAFTGATYAYGQVTLSGTAEAGSTLSIYDGYEWLGFATAGIDGKFTFTGSGWAEDEHAYGAIATDIAGNEAKTTSPYNPGAPAVLAAEPPPVMQRLASDTGSSSTDGITADASVTGTSDPNASVSFTLDGLSLSGTATADASGTWSFKPTDVSDGTHTIVASETNAAGVTGSSSLTFALDTKAPVPVITGMTQTNNKVTLSGTTGGTAGENVSIYDGNTLLGIATTAPDGSFTFTGTGAATAIHKYTASATDLAGNAGSTSGLAILGSKAANTLSGGAGDDLIQGGGGADKLTGGAGTDRFVYRAVGQSTSSAADTITDFAHGSDKIDFSNIGSLAFQGALVGTGSLTLNANSVAFLETGGNTHVLVNTSAIAETVSAANTGAAEMKIVLLGVNFGLTADDFQLS